MIGLSEMHDYGYRKDDVLPLTKEGAREWHRLAERIYPLFRDGTAGDYVSQEEIEQHDGIFGIKADAWDANMSSERIMNLLVTIPAESRRMNVGKDVIRILGSPAYICILQRKDRQSIAITPCAAEHPMSFKVPDRLLTDGQCRMRINGVQFVQALLEANGLAAGKDYQFKGRYEAEKNAVIISLEKDKREC